MYQPKYTHYLADVEKNKVKIQNCAVQNQEMASTSKLFWKRLDYFYFPAVTTWTDGKD